MAGFDGTLQQFLTDFGATKNLDRGFLKGSGLEDPAMLQQVQVGGDNATGPTFANPDAEKLLAKYKDVRVKQVGEDSDYSYYSISRPDGKTQQTKLKKDKDSALDSFLFSGGPMMLMAGPLGAAMGLSGAAATAAGGAILGGGLGFTNSGGKLSGAVKGAVAGGGTGALTMLPGVSSLSPVAQQAAVGGLRGLLTSGDPKQAILGALLGSVSGGMNTAGLTNPLLKQLVMTQLQQAIKLKG